jgi:hypothetical protein
LLEGGKSKPLSCKERGLERGRFVVYLHENSCTVMSETYPPSLHEDANADSRDWFADMFADFEPQNTTDGRYRE